MTDPRTVTTRRQLLQGWEASVLGRALLRSSATAPFIQPLPSQAVEAVTVAVAFAIASAALNTLNALVAMNAEGGSLGEQFAALNVKLDHSGKEAAVPRTDKPDF